MSWENIKLNVKDVIQIITFVVVAAFFFSAQSSKMESISDSVKEIKEDNKESNTEDKIFKQQLFNQVNANSIQIKIIEQKVLQLEEIARSRK